MADYDVSQIGDRFGRSAHRNMKIDRVANGYIVEYGTVVTKKIPKEGAEFDFETYQSEVREKKVFITNADLRDFLEEYFADEPKP